MEISVQGKTECSVSGQEVESPNDTLKGNEVRGGFTGAQRLIAQIQFERNFKKKANGEPFMRKRR